MSYKTITDKQSVFLLAKDKRLNFLTGSVRSGKTWISLLKFAWFAGLCPPNYEFLLCGKTITALKRNCLGLLGDLCGGDFSYTASNKEGRLYGRKVYLEGANDERSEQKIRGMTLGGAYCDEITLFPESFVNMLLSRLSLPDARLYATANPDAPKHYIKKNYLDNGEIDLAQWKFVIDDNTFLDPEYVAQLKKEYSGVYYDRYILGLWKRAEGAIYKTFTENEAEFYLENESIIKTAQTARITINGKPRGVEYINVGIDWGGNLSGHAFAATAVTSDFEYVVILASEYHSARDTTPEDVCDWAAAFIERIKRRYGRVDDVYADSAEQLLINLLRQKTDAAVRNSVKKPILDRIRFTTSLMARRRLFLTRECENTAEFFRCAAYDPKSADDKRLDDGSYDVDSGDAWEYSIERYMSYIIRE